MFRHILIIDDECDPLSAETTTLFDFSSALRGLFAAPSAMAEED